MSYAKQKSFAKGESYPLEKFFQVKKSAEITVLISQKRNTKMDLCFSLPGMENIR